MSGSPRALKVMKPLEKSYANAVTSRLKNKNDKHIQSYHLNILH